AGEHIERDVLAGVRARSIADGGVKWAALRQPAWTGDTLTSIGWDHEAYVVGPSVDDAISLLQALSKIVLSPTAHTTQRITLYPNPTRSDGYRAEAELTAQAAMNTRLALKAGYLWRYSNAPIAGFVKSDSTVTASIVVRWKAAQPAP